MRREALLSTRDESQSDWPIHISSSTIEEVQSFAKDVSSKRMQLITLIARYENELERLRQEWVALTEIPEYQRHADSQKSSMTCDELSLH